MGNAALSRDALFITRRTKDGARDGAPDTVFFLLVLLLLVLGAVMSFSASAVYAKGLW